MSAHGFSQIEVNDFTATGSTTGICHVGASSSINRRLILQDNLGPNLILVGTGTHRLMESTISINGKGMRLGEKREAGKVNVFLSNCRIEPLGEPGSKVEVNPSVVLELEGSTPRELLVKEQ